MKHVDSRERAAPLVPPAPHAAAPIFGDRLGVATRYAELLATAGVERGLLGPREVDRIWDRHLLNCAVVAELVESGERIVDIGSGAGLPGMPMAIARPDLRLTSGRAAAAPHRIPAEVVDGTRLGAEVVRGRAEEPRFAERSAEPTRSVEGGGVVGQADSVEPAAAAAGGPDAGDQGGAGADEVVEHRRVMSALGAVDVRVVECGVSYLSPPATVVVARRGQPGTARSASRRRSSRESL